MTPNKPLRGSLANFQQKLIENLRTAKEQPSVERRTFRQADVAPYGDDLYQDMDHDGDIYSGIDDATPPQRDREKLYLDPAPPTTVTLRVGTGTDVSRKPNYTKVNLKAKKLAHQ